MTGGEMGREAMAYVYQSPQRWATGMYRKAVLALACTKGNGGPSGPPFRASIDLNFDLLTTA